MKLPIRIVAEPLIWTYGPAGGVGPRLATCADVNLIWSLTPPTVMVSSQGRVVELILTPTFAEALKPLIPALTLPEKTPAIPPPVVDPAGFAAIRNAPCAPSMFFGKFVGSFVTFVVSQTSTFANAKRVSGAGTEVT